MKVGSSAADDVADSVTSLATLATDELASLKTDCASALTEPAKRAAAEMTAVVENLILSDLISQVIER